MWNREARSYSAWLSRLKRNPHLQTIALICILVLALITRMSYVDVIGHNDLTLFFAPWGQAVLDDGLLNIYADGKVDYPPVYPALLGLLAAVRQALNEQVSLILLLKIFPILSELALIALAHYLLRTSITASLVIPLLLAVHPGLIVTTAFWGQTDAIMVLLLTICLIALQKRRTRLAWFIFAIAMLTKFQAIVLLPLLFVLTLRRYGFRALVVSMVIATVTGFTVLILFWSGSGIRALQPYTGAVGGFSILSVNAYNIWHFANPSLWTWHPPLLHTAVSDILTIVGSVTYRQAGLFLLGVYTLLICFTAWKNADEEYEWTWAGALYFGFFMLPTQMHERYLYPALIFLFLAAGRDRRFWWVILPLSVTYTYNVIIPTQAPFYWAGVNILFILGDISLIVAALNMVLLMLTTYYVLTPKHARSQQSVVLRLLHIAVIGLVLAAGMLVVKPIDVPASATPVDATLDNSIRLIGYELDRQGGELNLTLYWTAFVHNNHDYTIFVHAMQGDQRLSQIDERPQDGRYPVYRWFNNDVVITQHTLTLPFSWSQPDFLWVGLYDPATMARAEVSSDGQEQSDGALRLPAWSTPVFRSNICSSGAADWTGLVNAGMQPLPAVLWNTSMESTNLSVAASERRS